MLEALRQEGMEIPEPLWDAARILDKLYLPTRDPNGLAQGAPTEFYTRREAEDAIHYSEEVLRFCGRLLGR